MVKLRQKLRGIVLSGLALILVSCSPPQDKVYVTKRNPKQEERYVNQKIIDRVEGNELFDYFNQDIGFPATLSRFLSDKGIKVEVYKGRVLKSDTSTAVLNGKDITIDSVVDGIYNSKSNTLSRPEIAKMSTLRHETGHCIFDIYGNDDIFSNPNYSGPTRDEFENSIRESSIYEIQRTNTLRNTVISTFNHVVEYHFKGTRREFEIRERLENTNINNYASLKEFMDYLISSDKDLSFEKDRFERHCINEALAEAFAIWLLDSTKTEANLNNLFDNLRYRGKSLKDSE